MPAGEPDDGTVFAAIYATDGVKLNLTNLVINVENYNGENDLYIAGVGSYWGANVRLESVDIVGGDQGIGIFNSGMLRIAAGVTVTGFREAGLLAGRTSVIRVFDPITVTGGINQEGDISEAIVALDSGVVSMTGGGTITPASGPGISVALDTRAAISAFRNGVITVSDATVNGTVWSGESSTVDLRNVVQGGGYLNPYRNSVLRVRSSQVGNGATAGEFFSGDFSVLRMDDTEVINFSTTEAITTYRYGVIDLRGTTNLNGRDINCADQRELRIDGTVTNIGTIGC